MARYFVRSLPTTPVGRSVREPHQVVDSTTNRIVDEFASKRAAEMDAKSRNETADPTQRGIGARAINKALAAGGFAERVTQGRGYVYFYGGEAESWPSSSIPVCYMRELSIDVVLEWRRLMAEAL